MEYEKEFSSDREFWDYTKKEFQKILLKQVGDIEEGSFLYSTFLEMYNRLENGNHWLKPNSLEYYELSDHYSPDHEVLKRNRAKFIWDMRVTENVLIHLMSSYRSYRVSEENKHLRRIAVVKG